MDPVSPPPSSLTALSSAGTASAQIGSILRERRKKLKLTLQAVAERAHLSIGFVSLVERDLATPSLSALVNIAQVLGLEVGDLIRVPDGDDVVSYASTRASFSLGNTAIAYGRLSADFPDSHINAVELMVPPGYVAEEVEHSGEDFLYLLEGRLRVVLDGKQYELRPGDAMHFRSSRSHGFTNPGDGPARLLWVGDLSIFPHRASDT
ncbi:helix-turn-helix domain-containing protein [Radicibacter daui]|uniref:helix-turn-helix domain-containing protein n=1 Tax=Radicibacter daui TaxID=3064829 RepID=UPI004046FACB